jgi:transcriptional regulator with XRE-family HTH domain
MELSRTIRKLRSEKGWSQETLAEKAYVSRQTVSNWENEKSLPDVHSLLILGDIFGVSLDELIKGDVETMKETIRNEDQKSLKKLNWVGVISFLLLSLVVFIVVKNVNKLREMKKAKEPVVEEAPTEKECPYCFTKININATRCPHCTSKLD